MSLKMFVQKDSQALMSQTVWVILWTPARSRWNWLLLFQKPNKCTVKCPAVRICQSSSAKVYFVSQSYTISCSIFSYIYFWFLISRCNFFISNSALLLAILLRSLFCWANFICIVKLAFGIRTFHANVSPPIPFSEIILCSISPINSAC